MDLLKTVRKTVRDYGQMGPGDCVAVAVSGGPDSVALLMVLSLLAPELGIHLVVAHLNHGLRPAADGDEAFVKELAAGYGWPCETGRADVAGLKTRLKLSTEEAARNARYTFLDQVAAKWNASRIALGHNRQDQAETVLMNLIRGSGSEGLKGMPPVRDGKYVRPLLFADRQDILAFLQDRGASWRLDETNCDTAFLRNRVRHRLLPQLREAFNGKIDGALGRLAEVMRLEDAFMDGEAERILAAWDVGPERHPVELSVTGLCGLHEALRGRVIKKLLEGFCPEKKGIAYAHVAAVRRIVEDGPSTGTVCLPFSIRAVREYDRIVLTGSGLPPGGIPEEDGDQNYLYDVEIPGKICIAEMGRMVTLSVGERDDFKWGAPGEASVVLMDYDRLELPLAIRNVRPGDRMEPMGMGGTKKIKSIFIDDKVPKRLRKRIPLLIDAQQSILWIGGSRCSERVRVTDATKWILKVEII